MPNLRRCIADAMLGMKILQATIEKKAVSAACRRDFAWLAVCEKQCSQRKASTYVRLHRSTLRYRSKFPFAKKEEADAAIVDLSLEHPELGSDKVLELMGELNDRHGAPDHIRSDNGPEFMGKSIQQ